MTADTYFKIFKLYPFKKMVWKIFFSNSLTFYFLLFSIRLPNIPHTEVIYSFLTLNLCQLPIAFSTSKFPKVIINSPMFYRIIAHYRDQRFPTEANRLWGPFCKPADLLVVTIIGIRRERIWWMRVLLIPEVLNMYETTLYNKELSASLKTLRLLREKS